MREEWQAEDVRLARTLLHALAEDVGRIRRTVPPDTSLSWRLERCAGVLHTLLLIGEPTAADLVALVAPGSDAAADAAIDYVDRRDKTLRNLLGYQERTVRVQPVEVGVAA